MRLFGEKHKLVLLVFLCALIVTLVGVLSSTNTYYAYTGFVFRMIGLPLLLASVWFSYRSFYLYAAFVPLGWVMVTARQPSFEVAWALDALLLLAMMIIVCVYKQKGRVLDRYSEELLYFMPDGVMVIDMERRVVFWNRTLEQMTGIKSGEIVGQAVERYGEIVYGEKGKVLASLLFEKDTEWERRFQLVRHDDGTISGHRTYFRDGMTFYMFGKAGFLYDSKGKPIGAVSSIRDITSFKKAENRLRINEALYRGIVSGQTELISRFLPDSTIIFVNDAYARFFGRQPEYFVGWRFIDDMADDSTEILLNSLQDMVRQQSPAMLELEYIISSEDRHLPDLKPKSAGADCSAGPEWADDIDYVFAPARHVWIEWNMHAVFDENGLISQYQAVGRDVSDRRITRMMLEEERERRFEYEQRLQQVATLSAMSAGLAHEIGQPLNALNIAIDSLYYFYERKGHLDESRTLKTMGDIRKGVERINNIIEHVRSLAGVGRYRGEEICNLNRALHEALEICAAQLEAHNIELVVEQAPGDLPVGADFTGLEELVINLVANARQALDEIPGDKKRITCRTFSDGEIAVLEISDNGYGIPAELKGRVFEPFFTTRAESGGMGIGLLVVQSIVTRCNGYIRILDNPGGGACIRVELPLALSARIPVGGA